MKNGSIIIIDDDEDDRELYKLAFEDLNVLNKVVIFFDSVDAFEYLKTTHEEIFFILCDIDMPKLNGLELREKINEDETLRLKAIPFLFLSSLDSDELVDKAFTLNIQGYFTKPSSVERLKIILVAIMSYWNNT
jgi:CheY-like chemotaxis protein